jgi:hypothetical protein
MAISSRAKRVVGVVSTLSIAASLLIGAPVSAAAPQQVTIDMITSFVEPGVPPTSVFVITGGGGVICASGTGIWESFAGHGWPSHVGALEVMIPDRLTCDDGSGTFVLQEQYHFNPNRVPATWVVLSGTGRYQSLRGQGTIVSEDLGNSQNHTVLTGFLIG